MSTTASEIKTDLLGKENLGSLLFKFSLPAITGTLVNASYNFVDRIFVGKAIGETGLASVAVTFPFVMIVLAFGMLIGMGTNSLISIKLGEKNRPDAEKLLGQAFFIFCIMYLVLGALGFLFAEKILLWSGATPEILPMAKEYFYIIVASTIFTFISYGANHFIRGEGGPWNAMMTMLLGAVMNIIFNPIFLFVFKMGIVGSAYATLLAQFVASAWVLSYYLGNRSVLKLKLQNFRIFRPTFKRVLIVGLPGFMMHAVASILTVVINNQLKKYGGSDAILGISIMATMFSINMLFFMPMIGLCQGMQPIIGYNFGAKNYQRVHGVIKMGLGVALAIGMIAFVITQFFPAQLFSLFSKEGGELGPRFVELGTHAIRRYMFLYPMIAIIAVSANLFQSIGKPKYAIIINLVKQLIVILPVILILPPIIGMDGIWYSGPISDGIAFILAVYLLNKQMRSMKVGEKEYSSSTSSSVVSPTLSPGE